MKTRGTSTDLFFALLVVIFIATGGFAMAKMGAAYKQQNANEGIGFRQAAVLETYAQMDAVMLSTQSVARFAVSEAITEYFKNGLKPLAAGDGDPTTPCGAIGPYTFWQDGDQLCYPGLSEVAPAFAQQISKAIERRWHNAIVRKPLSYTYRIVQVAGKRSLAGYAEQEIVLPIFGAPGQSVALATDAQKSVGAAAVSLPANMPDATITGREVFVDPDPHHDPRTQNPTYIVLHFTASGALSGSQIELRNSPLSIHYIVGKDGKIVQMVAESEKAYHAGGCDECADSYDNDRDGKSDGGDAECAAGKGSENGLQTKGFKCTDAGMNDKSIGIEIVNWGWLLPDYSYRNMQPITMDQLGGSCPRDYVQKRRVCTYSSYATYTGYNGKQACERFPETCWDEYPQEQLAAVIALVADIAQRWQIPPDHIIGHEEIKAEKSDPGPALDWNAIRQAVGNTPATTGTPALTTTRSLTWPAATHELNSCWGERTLGGAADLHDGIDVNAPAGAEIFAAADGTVIEVCAAMTGTCSCSLQDATCKANCQTKCPKSDFGNMVLIKHGDTLFTRYSHLESVLVRKGDAVIAGQPIGKAGSTGNSEAPHLDFKIYASYDDTNGVDKGKNPLCYFSQETLVQLSASSSAQSCREQYTVNSNIVMNKNNPHFEELCTDVAFRGAPVSVECAIADSSAAATITAPSTESARKVEITRRALEEQDLMDDVNAAAEQYKIPPSFLLAIITQESKGDPYAVSYSGCAGIAQFCAGTAAGTTYRDYFAPEKVKECTCTKKAGQYYCSLKTAQSTTCSAEDPRFDPTKAIPAAAKFLSLELERYKEYTNKYAFAAQAYNTGAGHVSPVLEACKQIEGADQPSVECMTQQLLGPPYNKGTQASYGEEVINHMAAWGGQVPGITTGIVCANVRLKNVGTLSFKPNFLVPIDDINTPVNDLVRTIGEFAKAEQNLKSAVEKGVAKYAKTDQEWTLSLGFCPSEDPAQGYIYEVIEGLEQCQANGQEDCVCDVLPAPGDLPERDYVLTFEKDGTITLVTTDQKQPVLRAQGWFSPLTNIYFFNDVDKTEDAKEMSQVRFQFTVNSGKIENRKTDYVLLPPQATTAPATIVNAKHPPIIGFYKLRKDELWGVFDLEKERLERSACLPTATVFPLCAKATLVTVDADGKNVQPEIKFGVKLKDTSPPTQVADLMLDSADGKALRITFTPPNDADLSGILLYCGDERGTSRIPVRIPAQQFGSGPFTYELKECDGKPLSLVKTTVRIHSFDLGGNENVVETHCQNEGWFSYTEKLRKRQALATGVPYAPAPDACPFSTG